MGSPFSSDGELDGVLPGIEKWQRAFDETSSELRVRDAGQHGRQSMRGGFGNLFGRVGSDVEAFARREIPGPVHVEAPLRRAESFAGSFARTMRSGRILRHGWNPPGIFHHAGSACSVNRVALRPPA